MMLLEDWNPFQFFVVFQIVAQILKSVNKAVICGLKIKTKINPLFMVTSDSIIT